MSDVTPLSTDIPIMGVMVMLVVIGFSMIYIQSQHVDFDVRNSESCEFLQKYFDMPMHLPFTKISKQELREKLRDTGCMNHDILMENYYTMNERESKR